MHQKQIESMKTDHEPKRMTIIKNQSGFSLIEAIIVIAIFSIAILGSMSMHLAASRTNSSARKVTMAMEYATDTMEQLMGLPTSSDYLNVDDDGNGTIDNIEESATRDTLDNDDDGTVDEADELEWHRSPAFTTTDLAVGTQSTGFTRGVTDPRIPEDPYYSQIFDLTWDVTNVDANGDGDTDAKQIDITVNFKSGDKFVRLSNLRNNLF